MIHIVFQEADIEALQKSFDLGEALKGEIIQVKDDYAVGPLNDIYTEEGIEARKQWWREVLAGGDYGGLVDTGRIDDNKIVREIIGRLENDPTEVMWIWAAQNKHDVSGYYWLMSQLRDFQGRVFILYLNNLPFINDKGHIFYPVNLFEIPAKEFLKARKLSRAITPAEFELDTEEWKKICDEGKAVRILEGGKKLVQYDYDFYDDELMKFSPPDWQKVSKMMHNLLSKSKQTTGDAYLLWRLKKMVEAGKIDARGELKNMKDFEVKAKASQTEPVPGSGVYVQGEQT